MLQPILTSETLHVAQIVPVTEAEGPGRPWRYGFKDVPWRQPLARPSR